MATSLQTVAATGATINSVGAKKIKMNRGEHVKSEVFMTQEKV